MKAKSTNNVEVLKSFFPKITKKDLEQFSKPKNYQILKRLEIGKDLRVIYGFQDEDIILKVQELNPDEIIFYTFRQDSKAWKLIGFEVESAFWDHAF